MLLLQSSLIATQSHNLPTHFLFRLPLSITSNFVMRPFPPCTPLYYPLNTLFESFITPQPRNLNLRHSSFPFTYSVHSGLLPFLRRFTPRNEVVDMIPTSIFSPVTALNNLNLRHASFPFMYSVHSGLLPFLRRFTPRNEVVDMIPTSIFSSLRSLKYCRHTKKRRTFRPSLPTVEIFYLIISLRQKDLLEELTRRTAVQK